MNRATGIGVEKAIRYARDAVSWPCVHEAAVGLRSSEFLAHVSRLQVQLQVLFEPPDRCPVPCISSQTRMRKGATGLRWVCAVAVPGLDGSSFALVRRSSYVDMI